MAWDEALFGAAFDGARRWFSPRASREVLTRRVEVEPERARLEVLARLLTSAPVTVTTSDEAGGHRGDVLYLPKHFDFAPTRELNLAALLVRLVWTCSSRALDFTRPAGLKDDDLVLVTALAAPTTRHRLLDDAPMLAGLLPRLERAMIEARPTPPLADARAQAVEAFVRLTLGADRWPSTLKGELSDEAWAWAEAALASVPPGQVVLNEVLRRLPLLPAAPRRWLRAGPREPSVPLWGELMLPVARAFTVPAPKQQADASSLPGGTEVQKRVVTQPQRIEEPNNELAENPLVHSFEKVHTLETYKGGSKRIDGDDELAAHQKALDELDLKQVMRSHQRARSLYRADVLIDGAVGDLEDESTGPAEATYDEWDEARHQWRREWCRLTTRQVEIAEGADEALRALRGRLVRTTTGLRAVFEQLEAARAWRLRQVSGPDVDIDALVARYGALRAGQCDQTRLYAARRRHTRDTAVLVLLDASLSTDAWVANRRVMDVEKEAVIALGDALDGLFDEVSVAAFCSQTRRDCRFLLAKRFDEPWAAGARRVMSLSPGGFTRIGPALRHATRLLLECGARKRLLLLVSDGKPSDLDRYEGRYGVADVHRAVIDAQASGVVMHALAVDPAAKAWLPSMFGAGRASVVSRPEELVRVLATVTSTALRG